ncbi:hypothetical protein J5226_05725 [Lysobacter sp. K5869]|uniref:hypothetical protein n=1 Tax=Lysobacter sp. K5869 TaxID=2820808 RepID=UPI001C060CAA|nr:hypothetical protein [Lysobacter sp. K5869]QWP77905.1 hypothetical protein J5226_05725 [Lysobacter sp. K5869]
MDAAPPEPTRPDPTKPAPATPASAAPRSNAPAWIAFALPPLACALWLAWAALALGYAESHGDRAYELVVYGFGGAGLTGLIAIGVLIWAGLRGVIGRALIGLFAGLLLSPLLLWFGAGAVLSARRKDFEQRQEQVRLLADTARRGDAARIRAAIDALPDRPGPARALCMLQGRDSYRLVHWLWFNEQGYGPNLESEPLLSAAAAVVDGPAPTEVKQAALRTVLRALIDRDEPRHFAAWAALWRRTLPQPAPRPMRLSALAEETGDCTLGDPAGRALSQWQDDGVRAWLDAGVGFEPDRAQPIAALRALRRADTLRALLAADPRIAAMLRDDRDAGEDALSAQADSLSATLDAAPDPAQAVALIEALQAAGARPRIIGPVTACELFDRGEQRRDLARDTPQRQAAAQRVRAVLCPAEAKAPKRAAAKKTTK